MNRKSDSEKQSRAPKGSRKMNGHSFSFVVPGKPIGKQRARSGRGGRHYTPAKTREYERTIAFAALDVRPNEWPLDARYRIVVWCSGANPNTDASNVLKSVEDACNGILWRDDRQIDSCTCERITGETAGIRVLVEAKTA